MACGEKSGDGEGEKNPPSRSILSLPICGVHPSKPPPPDRRRPSSPPAKALSVNCPHPHPSSSSSKPLTPPPALYPSTYYLVLAPCVLYPSSPLLPPSAIPSPPLSSTSTVAAAAGIVYSVRLDWREGLRPVLCLSAFGTVERTRGEARRGGCRSAFLPESCVVPSAEGRKSRRGRTSFGCVPGQLLFAQSGGGGGSRGRKGK